MRLWSVRDPESTAQVGTWFALAGGIFSVAMALAVPESTGSSAGAVATYGVAACLLVLGGTGWRASHRVPPVCWSVLPVVGTVGIVLLDLVSRDASAAAQVFFLWPVLYSAYLLTRAATLVVLVAVAAGEILVVSAAGSTTHAVTDAGALLTTLTVMAFVVVKLRERVDRLVTSLADQAMRDGLTGLLNRRAFDAAIGAAVDAARAAEGVLAFLSIDLDNLKEINDTFGHAAGDAALCQVAVALRAVVRADDGVFRPGGDEFGVLLPGCSRSDALDRAVHLRDRLDAAGGNPTATVSVGVACWPGTAAAAEQLVAEADRALYAAKRSGRNCAVTAA